MLYQLSYEATHWERGQLIELRKRRSLIATETHEHNTNRPFGKKKSRIIAWELKIEEEHLFRPFLRLFRRKHDLGGLQKRTKPAKNRTRQWGEPIIYSICPPRGLRYVQVKKSLLLDDFSLKSQQLVPNYFLYPEKCPDVHLRKIWPQVLSK